MAKTQKTQDGKSQASKGSEKLLGKVVPAIVEDPTVLKVLLNSRDVSRIVETWNDLSIAIFGVGNIELGRTLTNGNGRTEFFIPENVIGDEEGYVSIVVSLGDGYEANEVALEKARIGQNKVVPRLIRGEVLWSTNDNIQLWLLFSYIVAAGGAWLVIGYVIFQIIKIKRFSKL